MALAAAALAVGGCGGGGGDAPATTDTAARETAEAPVRLRVFVPNPPLRDLARALAGDAIEIVDPWAKSDGDPAFWNPSPDDVLAIQRCGLVVVNGANYEKWTVQAALPRARTLNLSANVLPQLIEEQGETHSHGPEGAHSHAGTAFTTWLSPAILRVEARALADALVKRLPAAAAAIEANAAGLDARLAGIGTALSEVGKRQPHWLGSHPVYQYLAQAGAMTIDCVHWEPGEMPAESQWDAFRALRAKAPKPRATMLWEGEPGAEIRARLAAEGVDVLVFSPLGAPAGDAVGFVDYLAARVAEMAKAVP